MTDLMQQVWVIPYDPSDMAPLPALLKHGTDACLYDRKTKTFGHLIPLYIGQCYDTFEQCRAAMIDARVEALDEAREHARSLANAIEHIRTIPAAAFPNVSREVREQEGQQEAQGQKEAQAEEVKPAAKPELKQRPSRRS